MEKFNATAHLSNEQLNKITKDNIKNALKSLLKEKSLKSVTVTELVKKAGVSRTAFYRNYESMEDILSEIGEGFISTVKKYLPEVKKHIDPYELLLEMFKKIKETESELKLIFKSHIHLDDLWPKENPSGKLHGEKNTLERYSLVGIEGAMKAIIGDWIINGMVESAEEMASVCAELLR